MDKDFFSVDVLSVPKILITEKDFLIVYKPPGIHSAPIKNSAGTLFEWVCGKFPDVAKLTGRNKGEGGLLHRLDFETQGLMLLARTEEGMENLLLQQREGKIIKEYCALAVKTEARLPGFPMGPLTLPMKNLIIQSAFRPYGVGRTAVRPLLQGEKEYATEIIESMELQKDLFSFRIKITSGFRHQIRSHLAWIGFPIINDKLYGGPPFGNGILGLRASAIFFFDPTSGEKVTCSINPLDIKNLLK